MVVGFEFDSRGFDDDVDGFAAGLDFDGFVVGASHVFALDENVSAFDDTFCELGKKISVSHDIVPLGAVFAVAGIFIGPGDFGRDGEFGDGDAALEVRYLCALSDKANNV